MKVYILGYCNVSIFVKTALFSKWYVNVFKHDNYFVSPGNHTRNAPFNSSHFSLPACKDPNALGMQSGKIPDSRINASSEWRDGKWGPRYGRLHGDKCWIARSRDTSQWLQIDFKYKATVTEILTQGRPNVNQWVKNYTIAYSDDGVNFTTYKGDKGQDKVTVIYFSVPQLLGRL
jgi:hypothetical protein